MVFFQHFFTTLAHVSIHAVNFYLYHSRLEQYKSDQKIDMKWVYFKENCHPYEERIITVPNYIADLSYANSYLRYAQLFDSRALNCFNDNEMIKCYESIKDSISEIQVEEIYKFREVSGDFAGLHDTNRGGHGQYDIFVRGYHMDSSIIEFVYYVDTTLRLENVSGFVAAQHVHDQPAPILWQVRTKEYLDSLDRRGGSQPRKIK